MSDLDEPEFLQELRGVVGADELLTSSSIRAGYLVEWTGHFQGSALAGARPSSTAEVAGVLRLCAQHRVAVTPQGGNTGLVGGSVPRFSGPQADAV
ncbi:MAG: FAD-binding protein, partial [Candidatus Nanopelagicales bacterium]